MKNAFEIEVDVWWIFWGKKKFRSVWFGLGFKGGGMEQRHRADKKPVNNFNFLLFKSNLVKGQRSNGDSVAPPSG